MRIAVLTIGNELLSGKTINTNANWLSKKLSSIGSTIALHITIPDDQESITNKDANIADCFKNIWKLIN